jgi:hypothetical protein
LNYQDDEFINQIYPRPKINELQPTHEYALVPLQTVPQITDKILKQIDKKLLNVESFTTEVINMSCAISYK